MNKPLKLFLIVILSFITIGCSNKIAKSDKI